MAEGKGSDRKRTEGKMAKRKRGEGKRGKGLFKVFDNSNSSCSFLSSLLPHLHISTLTCCQQEEALREDRKRREALREEERKQEEEVERVRRQQEVRHELFLALMSCLFILCTNSNTIYTLERSNYTLTPFLSSWFLSSQVNVEWFLDLQNDSTIDTRLSDGDQSISN